MQTVYLGSSFQVRADDRPTYNQHPQRSGRAGAGQGEMVALVCHYNIYRDTVADESSMNAVYTQKVI